jgi:VCBS repeat-containing protein
VLADATDVENHELTASVAEGPSHGTVVVESNGAFTYTPDVDFYGQDRFFVVASDGHPGGESAPTPVTIQVLPKPDSLIANPDSYTVVEDQTLATGEPDLTLVPFVSQWRYLHPQDGIDPATLDADFNSTWYRQGLDSSGYGGPAFSGPAHAPFYSSYGFPPIPAVTQLEYPGIGKNGTVYFLRSFEFDGDPAAVTDLVADIRLDDGAFFYLNGHEVGRFNVGEGADTYGLYAPELGNDAAVTSVSLEKRLVRGVNYLGVSVHNIEVFFDSVDDLWFDMRLRAF